MSANENLEKLDPIENLEKLDPMAALAVLVLAQQAQAGRNALHEDEIVRRATDAILEFGDVWKAVSGMHERLAES